MTYSLHAAFYRLPPQQQSGDVAERIAAELARLAREAKDADLPMLSYLIECARLEALQAARSRESLALKGADGSPGVGIVYGPGYYIQSRLRLRPFARPGKFLGPHIVEWQNHHN